MATRKGVLVQLSLMAVGSALVALHHSVATTVVGAFLVGSVLAPMATYYSLVLGTLAPAHRRAEVFALLRTAKAVGVIIASAVLTVVSLPIALIVVTALMIAVIIAVAMATAGRA